MNMSIEEYFSKHWQQDWSQFDLTGYNILSKLPCNGKETIIDVGCGYNPLKQWFEDRLVGIDPYNDSADVKVSIEDFETDQKFDIALALGSINFGSMQDIFWQTEKMCSLIKEGGKVIWRQNPGIHDHPNDYFKDIDLFNWTFKINITIAEALDMEVVDLRWDNNRIYSEWRKPYVGNVTGVSD